MKKICPVRPNEFINKFDFRVMDCFEKTRCIIREIFHPNSVYYFLLFKDYRSIFFRNLCSNYQEYVDIKSRVSFEFVSRDGMEFESEIRRLVDEEELVILIVDLFFVKDSPRYQKEHHPHFYVLQGYDNRGCFIIDEDFSSQYHIPANAVDGVSYIERYIEMEELKMQCLAVRMLNEVRNQVPREGDFMLYVKGTSTDTYSCPINEVLVDFRALLMDLMNRAEELEEMFKSSMEKYMEVFPEKHKESSVLFKAKLQETNGTMAFMPEEVVTPAHLFDQRNHYTSLSTWQRVFSLRLPSGEYKATLENQMQKVVGRYRTMNNLVWKSLVVGDVSVCKNIIPRYLDGIATEEKLMIERILDIYDLLAIHLDFSLTK